MTSRAIVIDACIARAAGPEKAVHPTSTACRNLLMAVKDCGHTLVSSRSIREEWRRHRSGFARTWLASMVAQKLVTDVEDSEIQGLREAIRELASSRRQADAILKDVHLFEAATRSGKCIASIETNCFEAMESLPAIPSEVHDVEVVDPVAGAEALLQWLRDGAKSSRCKSPHCRRLKAKPRSA